MRPITLLLAALFVLVNFSSCVKDKCEREITYIKSTPIYIHPSEYRIAQLTNEAPRALEKPGKIYFYNNYIFINEQREGVHIIDNSNPASPVNIGFMPIPGNVDIAISNQVLYADNYTDLLTIDISDIDQPRLVKRSEEVFPHLGSDATKGFLVYYEQEQVTEMVSCNDHNVGRGWANQIDGSAPFATAEAGNLNSSQDGGSGVGGSLARFTITKNHLYTINDSQMHVFQIGNDQCPNHVSVVNLGWGIETIFPHDNKLFIGSNTGMHIYDLSNPSNPDYLSGYSHWTACDPVYVKDNYAYVTLRSGTLCNGSTINQLDLIDISDIRNPFLVTSFPMDNPHGLSIRDNNLFLCEGEYGLKVFDIEDPLQLNNRELQHLTDRAATDVIVVPDDRNTLLMIGDDGFYQYNFDNPRQLEELSHLPVVGLR